MTDAHGQAAHRVRLEWGPTGAAAIAGDADVAVVVDVLSFTTTLSLAVEHGITVFPYRWKDERAAAYAAERDAVMAVGRFEARHGQAGVSLSPSSLSTVEGVERLVLPSPNGSTIAFALTGTGAQVVGGCLRNAGAVAGWLAPRVDDGACVAVVPAGERWPDGTLRPAVEDLWGAGAVLAALMSMDRHVDMSPEAQVAAEAFRSVESDLTDTLLGCASGVELVQAGFADDVRIAAEHDASRVVPVLVGDAFRG